MADIEGMAEISRVLGMPIEALMDLLGFVSKRFIEGIGKGTIFTIKKADENFKASVKSIITHKQRDEFLRGGEATCAEIFKEKGALPDQVDTLKNISSWDSYEAQEFIKACEEAHVKIVPINQNPVCFMYHSSDAEKLVVGYNKLKELSQDINLSENEVKNVKEHYNSLDDKEGREKEVGALVKEVSDKYTLKDEIDLLKAADVVVKKKIADKAEKKLSDMNSYIIPKELVEIPKKDNEEYGFMNITTEKGIASIPKHEKKNKELDNSLEEVFIDPEQSYPFKDKNGNTNTILGKDLQKELEELEKLKEKRMKLIQKDNKTKENNIVLGKDLGGKTSKEDALGVNDSTKEHFQRGDFKPQTPKTR